MLRVAIALTAGLTLGACRVPQSEECARYVKCQKAYDDSVETTAYEPDGSCWSSPQAGEECTDQCEVALDALSEVPDAPKDCQSE